jgi:hypothetical protein
MEKEFIKEGNDIIAKFMGWFQQNDRESPYLWYKANEPMVSVAYDLRATATRDLPFHRDWNYLMKVVEKIEDLDPNERVTHMYSIEITGNGTTISKNIWGAGEKNIIHRENSYNRRLINTWIAVVEFIKWHNNGKKKVVPEDVCACPDGGQYMDGYYDTHCDRCGKRLP